MDENEEDIIQVQRNMSEGAPWKRIQKTTFTRWVNEQLKEVGGHIVDLERDLSDGLLLTSLLEVLSKKKLGTKEILRQRKLETVTKALKFLEEDEKIKLVNIDSEAIVDGKTKLILGLIWELILHYSISIPHSEETEQQEKQQGSVKFLLMSWINDKVSNLTIKNFKTDWKDGKAIGALVDGVAPGLCPDWEDWDAMEAEGNVTTAMELAKKWLDIPQLIRPGDMISSEADELSMITYLSQFPHAKLNPEAPLRARVKVYGPGLDCKGNVVDQSTSFNVKTFSAGTLEISVLDPKEEVIECSTTVCKDGQQTYVCHYVPKKEGQYRVTIKFNGKDILKSPFLVLVQTSAMIETLTHELELMKNKLSKAQEDARQYKMDITQLNDQLLAVKGQSILKEGEVSTLKNQLFNEQERAKQVQAEIQSLQDQLNKEQIQSRAYQQENETLTYRILEETERSKENEYEMNGLNEVILEKQAKINLYEAERKSLNEKLSKSCEFSTQLQEEIASLKNKLFQEEWNYEQEIKILQTQLTEEQEMAKQLKHEITSVKYQLCKEHGLSKQYEFELESLNDQLIDEQWRSQHCEQAVDSVHDQLLVNQQISTQYEQEIECLIDYVQEEKVHVKQYEQKLQCLKCQLRESQQRSKEYEQDIESLNEHSLKDEEQSKLLNAQLLECQTKSKEFEHKTEFLNDRLLEEQGISKQLRRELESMNYRLYEIQEQADLYEQEITSLNETLVNEKKKMRYLNQKIISLKDQMYEEQGRTTQYEHTIESFKHHIYEKEKHLVQSQQEIKVLNYLLADKQERLDQYEQEMKGVKRFQDMPDSIYLQPNERTCCVEGCELAEDVALCALSLSLACKTATEPSSIKLCFATGALLTATGYSFASRKKMIPAGFIGLLSACLLESCGYSMCRQCFIDLELPIKPTPHLGEFLTSLIF